MITWIVNWPEWVGVPIGLAVSFAAFLYLKKRWNL
jgi:hypothetical protein